MLNQFTDNALTTLATGISASDTQLTVAAGDGAKYPNVASGTKYFIITMEDASGNRELIRCEHRSGDLFGSGGFPLIRGYGGTTARIWPAGSSVDLRWSSASVASLFAESISLAGSLTPAQIVSNQNDYNPTGLNAASVLRLSSDALRTVTGIVGGEQGRIMVVQNVGANDIRFATEDAGSTGVNRFAFAADVTLKPNECYLLQYDATTLRWRQIGISEMLLAAAAQSQKYVAGITGGTSTAYTLTPAPAITSLVAQQRFRVVFHTVPGAAPTLSVSGLTAKALKVKDYLGVKQAVTASMIPSGWAADVEYDGTDWVVLDVSPMSYQNPSAGSVRETFQVLGDRTVHIDSFGAVGDGVTDDLVPLTNFYNSLNARPGVPHYLGAKTYATSAPLPETNVSHTLLYGAGCARHDVGAPITGTIIKAIGSVASWAGKVIRTIKPISGVGAQHLSGNVELGVCYQGFDTAEKAFAASSLFGAQIDIAPVECRVTGAVFGTVAAGGGESFDMQLCRIRLELSQTMTAAKTAYGASFGGDSVANFSLNQVYINGLHGDVALGINSGTDNNEWWIRHHATGVATEGWSVTGGASDALSSRNERIRFYTGNKPLHVYGTDLTAFPAHDIYVECLDKGNGVADPVVGPGATCYWQNNANSPIGDTPPVAYNPTVTPGNSGSGGVFTNATATGFKLTRGKHVTMWGTVVMTDPSGGGAISLDLSLGDTVNASFSGIGTAVRADALAMSLAGIALPGVSKMAFFRSFDGAYPTLPAGSVFSYHISFIKA